MKNSLKTKLEIKAVPGGNGYKFRGYASVFNTLDSHYDIIKPGAFDGVISEIKAGNQPMPTLFFGHEHGSIPVGIITDLGVDSKGLWIDAELTPGLSVAEDVRAAINHGSMSGLSIGYVVGLHQYDDDGVRVIQTIKALPEVSILTWQSNPDAVITEVKGRGRNRRDTTKEALTWVNIAMDHPDLYQGLRQLDESFD